MKYSASKFTYTTNLDLIASIDDILAELARHEQVLASTDVGRLIYFSRVYAITNRNIHQACMNGYFSHPVLMGQLQVQFAHLYFRTLNNYARSGLMPRQWQIAIDHRLIRIQPAGLSLFLAINAHIRCDAVTALKNLTIQPKLLAGDYFRVNQLLFRSSREIVKSYNPDLRLWLVREIARKILIVPICYIIFTWRRKAWRNFSTLNEASCKREPTPCATIPSPQSIQIRRIQPAFANQSDI